MLTTGMSQQEFNGFIEERKQQIPQFIIESIKK
jgi:hypothetical protein